MDVRVVCAYGRVMVDPAASDTPECPVVYVPGAAGSVLVWDGFSAWLCGFHADMLIRLGVIGTVADGHCSNCGEGVHAG